MRKHELDKLVRYFALWSGLRARVVLGEGGFRLEGSFPRGLYPDEVERSLEIAVLELLSLAGGRLDPDALRMLTLAGRSRGWAGMVEGAKALGVLRKYGFFLGQGVKDGERVPVA